MSAKRSRVTYVFDAYCGWCYGFGPVVADFVREHAEEIELEVVSGGLFLGDAVAPATTMPHLVSANQRITDLTGAEFGAGYRTLLADPSFAMDSLDAAKGFVALRSAAPERALELAEALHLAFYRDGLSLSASETYRQIAAEHSLDASELLDSLISSVTAARAVEDFRRARSLGATSFPTLIVHTPTGLGRLGGPISTAAQLGEALRQYRLRTA